MEGRCGWCSTLLPKSLTFGSGVDSSDVDLGLDEDKREDGEKEFGEDEQIDVTGGCSVLLLALLFIHGESV